jgi:hypothetical protein
MVSYLETECRKKVMASTGLPPDIEAGLDRGKRFPAQFSCVRLGEMYPAGCRNARRGKIPKADSSG